MVFDKIKGPLFVLLYLLLCDIYSILFICHFMWKNISRKDVSHNVHKKGMPDECRLQNAAEKFHILFIILKNKKASVNNSLKVEYKQDMPFVTFNFIPTF